MSTAVSERMSTELHRVPRETPVRACLKIMRENDIRHLPARRLLDHPLTRIATKRDGFRSALESHGRHLGRRHRRQ